jgi:hypothetical protein
MRNIGLASLVLGSLLVVVLLLRDRDETQLDAEASSEVASVGPSLAESGATPREDRRPGTRPLDDRVPGSAPARIRFAAPPSSFESPEAEIAWLRHALEKARTRGVQVAGLQARIEASEPAAPAHVREGIARDQVEVEARIEELERRLDHLEGARSSPVRVRGQR